MASVCAAPIKGVVIRIIQLDTCGIPVTGASSHVVVTNLFTQVQMTPQYEAGTDFFERTADGTIGVNQVDPPILKRMQLQTDLMSVDPDMMPYVLSARELVSTAPVSGYGFAMAEGVSTSHYSMEVWQRVAGAGACSAGGLQQYIYNAWPHCYNTQVAAYAVTNARSTLSFQCDTAQASLAWSDGPGAASWLPTGASGFVQAGEHWLWNITTVTPPSPACGAVILA
jgi:hypothetical protein